MDIVSGLQGMLRNTVIRTILLVLCADLCRRRVLLCYRFKIEDEIQWHQKLVISRMRRGGFTHSVVIEAC